MNDLTGQLDIPWHLLENFARQTALRQLTHNEGANGKNLWLCDASGGSASLSGNKLYKLFGNLYTAKALGKPILSMGGMWSNHLHALAYAGFKLGIKTIALVRSTELGRAEQGNITDADKTVTSKIKQASFKLSPTLEDCRSWGMEFVFVTPTEYRQLRENSILESWAQRYGALAVPEGGSNTLAMLGLACWGRVLKESAQQKNIDLITLPSGTGGTLAGLALGLAAEVPVWGFAAFKNAGFLRQDIEGFIQRYKEALGLNDLDCPTDWTLETEYSYGRFAQLKEQDLEKMLELEKSYGLSLEPVYSGKLFLAVHELITTLNYSNVVLVHTGGLQGRRGYHLPYRADTNSLALDELFSQMERI